MALKVPKMGLNQLMKDGYKNSEGLDEVVFRNIQAVNELTNMTRTSYGPNGKNKMVINHLEKLFVTNDAATMMKELEVVHPAARMLVLSSHQQETEMGDGTNFVMVFAGELLQQAEYLLRMGLVPAEVIQGYNLAGKKALEFMEELSVYQIKNPLDPLELIKPVRSALSSKQHGYEDFLGELVVKACLECMPKKNPSAFSVDSIRIVKIMGASVLDTSVVRGMVFGREPEGTVTRKDNAKVAIFSCAIDIQTTETKGTVLIHNAQEMLDFSKGEESQLEAVIKELAATGVNVVVTGSACSELALHFLNRYGILVMKILSKFELRRLCRVTGATVMTRVGPPTAEEMGLCDVVETIEIGSDRCVVFRQEEESTKTATIVIRGSTMNLLDDIERAIDDAVNVVKAVAKDGRLLAGAGAFEIELARRIRSYGEKTPGLNQYAIKKFAEALEVVPRTLAENAGMDSTEVVSNLYAAHEKGDSTSGVDVESNEDGVLDAVKANIFDVLSIKSWAMKLASFSAETVLSVDQIIMSKQAGGPKAKENKGWDED